MYVRLCRSVFRTFTRRLVLVWAVVASSSRVVFYKSFARLTTPSKYWSFLSERAHVLWGCSVFVSFCVSSSYFETGPRGCGTDLRFTITRHGCRSYLARETRFHNGQHRCTTVSIDVRWTISRTQRYCFDTAFGYNASARSRQIERAPFQQRT